MEHLDVLTPEGKPTGKTISKAEVHRTGAWHRAAHVWIVNEAGELLLQLRSRNKENDPGLWDISVAGHVSAGESARVSALREVAEEIGLEIREDELHHLFTFREPRVLNGGKYLDNEFHEVFLLRREVDIAALELQIEEVEAVKWISQEELQALVHARSAELVAHWEEYEALLGFLAG